jgi:hypothetical protein
VVTWVTPKKRAASHKWRRARSRAERRNLNARRQRRRMPSPTRVSRLRPGLRERKKLSRWRSLCLALPPMRLQQGKSPP